MRYKTWKEKGKPHVSWWDKSPRVIDYWESITNEEQHYKAVKCCYSLMYVIFIVGVLLGMLLGGFFL